MFERQYKSGGNGIQPSPPMRSRMLRLHPLADLRQPRMSFAAMPRQITVVLPRAFGCPCSRIDSTRRISERNL